MRDLGQESSNLHIGILSWLQPPEQFQDQRIAVEDGGVGLLGRADPRWQARFVIFISRNAVEAAPLRVPAGRPVSPASGDSRIL